MPETKGKSSEQTMTYLGDMLRLTRHPRLVIAFSAGFLRFFLDYGFLTYFPAVSRPRSRHLDGHRWPAVYLFFRRRHDDG